MKQPMINTMMTKKFDNLYTPVEAILPLLKYIPQSIQTIWECCDSGNSLITKTLRDHSWDVVSSDIATGTNFLEDWCADFGGEFSDTGIDMIITNPPYSLKDQFLEKCYQYNIPFALLLPLTALEGIKRGRMYNNGISVIVLDKRIDFTGKKSNWFNVSWFVWGLWKESRLFFEHVE
jgi:hypothetical protein